MPICLLRKSCKLTSDLSWPFLKAQNARLIVNLPVHLAESRRTKPEVISGIAGPEKKFLLIATPNIHYLTVKAFTVMHRVRWRQEATYNFHETRSEIVVQESITRRDTGRRGNINCTITPPVERRFDATNTTRLDSVFPS